MSSHDQQAPDLLQVNRVAQHASEEAPLACIQNRLDAAEAHRDSLRAQLEAQQKQLVAMTARLWALEQLWQTVKHGRAYKLLRRLGRWQWVEQLLAHPRRVGSTTSPFDHCDEWPPIITLSHNIPDLLPTDFSYVAAFRIRNVGAQPIRLPPQHSLPWVGSPTASYHRIDVNLDGRFLLSTQVRNDRVQPGGSASIFFPLHSGAEGYHRLQVLLITPRPGTTQARGRIMFEAGYRVSRAATGLDLPARLKAFVFMLRYADLPLLVGRLRCRYARILFRVAGWGRRRSINLRRLKEHNRQLAFMEKQTRKRRVASLPCYLTIDTTVQCNLRCPLCFRQYAGAAETLRAAGDMPSDVMDEIIRTLLPTAYTVNTSILGEPLLSPHLDRLLDVCRGFEVFLSFTTNGTLLNKKGLLDRLIPVLHRLEISVDSATAEMFEKLRAGARFEHVLRNARMVGRIRSSLPDPKFHFGFSMTLYRENLTEIPDLLRLVADCGGNFLRTDIGMVFSKSDLHHSILNCPEAYNDAFRTAHECARVLGVTLLMRPPFVENGESEATRYGVCDYLYTHACVTTDGRFKPCFCIAPPMRRPTTQTLRSLWNSKDLRQLRSQHDTERAPELCRKCYMVLQGRDSVASRRELFVRGDAAQPD